MGYVNESHTTPAKALKILRNGVFLRNYTPVPPVVKSQYGYRSGPISQIEKKAINKALVDRDYTWGNSLSVIAAIEQVENVTTQTPFGTSSPSLVNQRTYSVHRRPASIIETDSRYWPASDPAPRGDTVRQTGYGCALIIPDYFSSPPERTGSLDQKATQIMRSMRPTKPDFELFRFLGELKDLPQFWKTSNYIPTKLSEAGGSYLNVVFGIQPTWKDLNTASKAVLQSDKILREFALKALTTVKRRRTLVLDTKSEYSSGQLTSGVSNSVVSGKYVIAADLGNTYSSVFDVGCYLDVTCDYRRELRVFSDFEYYIGDPDGFLSRIDSYRDKARKVLGTGISPSNVYDLTPWSWLGNWFLDFSSLLKYQQDVADNGLVARTSGYLIEDRYNLLAQPYKVASPGSGIKVVSNHPIVTMAERQWRWAGSPYSMSPNWDLSDFQWAIVGALGMTKANKIPFLRNL